MRQARQFTRTALVRIIEELEFRHLHNKTINYSKYHFILVGLDLFFKKEPLSHGRWWLLLINYGVPLCSADVQAFNIWNYVYSANECNNDDGDNNNNFSGVFAASPFASLRKTRVKCRRAHLINKLMSRVSKSVVTWQRWYARYGEGLAITTS